MGPHPGRMLVDLAFEPDQRPEDGCGEDADRYVQLMGDVQGHGPTTSCSRARTGDPASLVPEDAAGAANRP